MMSLTKPMQTRIFVSLLWGILGISCVAAQAQEAASIVVKGALVNSRVFKLSDLEALPRTDIVESRAIERNQQRELRKITYRGVLLRDLLQSAGLKEKERHDFRKTLIVAKARDGYIGLFTWAEIFNTKAGDHILVILEADGKPLAGSEGPLALRSFEDIRPGPRHVKWLEQIEVVAIPN